MIPDTDTRSFINNRFWSGLKTLFGLLRYLFLRALGIFATTAVGVFLVVLLMNQSYFIDEAISKEANYAAVDYIYTNYPHLSSFTNPEEYQRTLEDLTATFANQAGLNLPYWPRQLRWTWNMLTFNWPDVKGIMVTDAGAKVTFRAQNTSFDMRYKALAIIGQYFPNTLLIISVAYTLIFSLGVPLALSLSRRYNHWMDRLLTGLAPLSSVPSWVYGIVLVTIFAFELHWLPFGGKYDLMPPENKWQYIPVIARHLLLPVLAVILSMFFQVVYTWRTYFMLYSQEDYVELAVAKGIPPRRLEFQYILRPTLPYILTSFALTLTGFWQMTTALEYFFNWPGIGWMYIRSLLMDDLIVSLGVVVIFAYLLGGLVLILDLAYLALDPRIRYNIMTGSNLESRIAQAKRAVQGNRIQIRLNLPRIAPREWWRAYKEWYIWSARPFLAELRSYPTALISLALIAVFLAASIYALFTYPYSELDQLWNPGLSQYKTRPTLARPLWFNWFRQHDLPENVIIDSRDHPELKKSEPNSSNGENTSITYSFYVPDGDFPQDIFLYFHTQIKKKEPFASFTWITPDRREFHLKNSIVVNSNYYDFSDNIPTRYLDSRYIRHNLVRNQGGESPHKVLFADPTSPELKPVGGTYQLRVNVITFEPDSQVDMEFVLLGQTYGWAGTDHLRRELSIGLLWGLPVALGIGLLGALTTSLLAMLIAAGAAWNGGWVDALTQRLTELNMILPILAVGVLLSIHFNISIWTVLLIAILLNAFGSTTRGYRAAFLQAKEAPYVEAARAYGASDLRIITKYLIPRIFPVMIPQVVMLIPGYVFLEATLAIFGVSTPYAPTWGRIIFDALSHGVHSGYYYWLLEPVSLLLVTSLAFAMLGFTLDRVLNPRLRTEGGMAIDKPIAQPRQGARLNLSRGTVATLAVAVLLVAFIVSSIQRGKSAQTAINNGNPLQASGSGTAGPVVASLPTVVPASPTRPFPTLRATPAASPTVPSVSTVLMPEPTSTPVPTDALPTTYAVQRGEYPYCIARRFNVDPNELLALNGLSSGQTLFTGVILQLPQTGKPFPGQRMLQAHPATYVVSASSETLYTIACAFGDLDPMAIAQANDLAADSSLFVGQKLNIP